MSRRLIKGNAACVVGGLYAGCEYFFGYPITPASEVAHEAALLFPKLGRGFLQAESETAAINMMYGTSCSGRRVMTASSGPGMSLMMEGLSYMAGAELPGVIVDIMRAGPGLGNIGPEQSDYNQMVKGGGHGSYHNIVLAPASVQEMCDMTMLAFELADRYRNPAVVLADGVLGQMAELLEFPTAPLALPKDKAWAVAATAETRQNFISSIYLDFDVLERFNNSLQEKYATIEKAEPRSETYATEDADLVLVAYGISSRVAREACDELRRRGTRTGLFRPQTLWPFPKPALRRLAEPDRRRFLVVELSVGQLADDVRLTIECRRPVDLVYRLGGNVVTVEEIIAKVASLSGSDR